MALAAFLLRGGILVLLLALIPLPTTAALANAFGPALVGFVFGGPSASFLILVASVVATALAWLILAGLTGAAIDLALVEVASERPGSSTDGSKSGSAGHLWRAFTARMLAHVPTAAAAAWGAATIVGEAYAELIGPGDPSIPLALRVLLRVPGIVLVLLGTWVVGEAVGGAAVRHVAWGSGLGRSLRQGVRTILRPSAILILVVTNAVLAGVLVLGASVVSQAFERARFLLVDGGSALGSLIGVGLLSATWIATLVLVAVSVAYRAVAWTSFMRRHRPDGASRDAPRG